MSGNVIDFCLLNELASTPHREFIIRSIPLSWHVDTAWLSVQQHLIDLAICRMGWWAMGLILASLEQEAFPPQTQIPEYFTAPLPACWRKEAWSCSPSCSTCTHVCSTVTEHPMLAEKQSKKKKTPECATITLYKKIKERKTTIGWQCARGRGQTSTYSFQHELLRFFFLFSSL